jgi:hypothetical protein
MLGLPGPLGLCFLYNSVSPYRAIRLYTTVCPQNAMYMMSTTEHPLLICSDNHCRLMTTSPWFQRQLVTINLILFFEHPNSAAMLLSGSFRILLLYQRSYGTILFCVSIGPPGTFGMHTSQVHIVILTRFPCIHVPTGWVLSGIWGYWGSIAPMSVHFAVLGNEQNHCVVSICGILLFPCQMSHKIPLHFSEETHQSQFSAVVI